MAAVTPVVLLVIISMRYGREIYDDIYELTEEHYG